MTLEQRWLARVPAGAPGLQGAELLDVTVPRQDGREGLVEGTQVTVVYYGRSPAWIRLPSGVVLETEDHPRRKAPFLAWLALTVLGSGVFAVRSGIRAGRQGGGWLRRTPARFRGGLDVAVLLAAMVGAIVYQFAGSTPWPGIVAGCSSAGSASCCGGGRAAVRPPVSEAVAPGCAPAHSSGCRAIAGGARPARSQPAAAAVRGRPTRVTARWPTGTRLRAPRSLWYPESSAR
jgi:hypothetical protein